MRYRVAHRSAAARPGLTQVLGSGPKVSFVRSRNLVALASPNFFWPLLHLIHDFGDISSKGFAWGTVSGA